MRMIFTILNIQLLNTALLFLPLCNVQRRLVKKGSEMEIGSSYVPRLLSSGEQHFAGQNHLGQKKYTHKVSHSSKLMKNLYACRRIFSLKNLIRKRLSVSVICQYLNFPNFYFINIRIPRLILIEISKYCSKCIITK